MRCISDFNNVFPIFHRCCACTWHEFLIGTDEDKKFEADWAVNRPKSLAKDENWELVIQEGNVDMVFEELGTLNNMQWARASPNMF